MAERRYRSAALGLALGLSLVTAGCGSTRSATPPAVMEAGQLPPSAQLVGNKAAGGVTGTTIPLAKQNPTTALFSAIGVFQSCLQGQGQTFVGAPKAGDPNSPTNNPVYVKALIHCAAQSNILGALKAEQTAQQNLTPKQVAAENKTYLKWRTCMIGKGWVIPFPKPNAQGALFSFGAGGGGVPQMTPPPGQSLFNSPDLQECLTKAQGEQ